MWTVEKIKKKLVEARGEFARKVDGQGEFWCPICDKWYKAGNLYQIVGHSPPDRVVVFGLCLGCTEKADPEYVPAVVEAINERRDKVEQVDSRMKFLMKDFILKQ